MLLEGCSVSETLGRAAPGVGLTPALLSQLLPRLANSSLNPPPPPPPGEVLFSGAVLPPGRCRMGIILSHDGQGSLLRFLRVISGERQQLKGSFAAVPRGSLVTEMSPRPRPSQRALAQTVASRQPLCRTRLLAVKWFFGFRGLSPPGQTLSARLAPFVPLR